MYRITTNINFETDHNKIARYIDFAVSSSFSAADLLIGFFDFYSNKFKPADHIIAIKRNPPIMDKFLFKKEIKNKIPKN